MMGIKTGNFYKEMNVIILSILKPVQCMYMQHILSFKMKFVYLRYVAVHIIIKFLRKRIKNTGNYSSSMKNR